MTYEEAIKKLGLERYSQRIINSNSHGELFHLLDYIRLAEEIPPEYYEWLNTAIDKIVNWAENTWDRPDSIFQHINKQLKIQAISNPTLPIELREALFRL